MESMEFYENLYLSERYQTKKESLIQKMKQGNYPISAYVLVLIAEGPNQLEFFPTVLLYQGYIKTDKMYIVGISDSYMDAMYIVEKIFKDVYARTGTADIRAFFAKQRNDG